MSTVTVSNIQTANATIPLTITTGNTNAGALIVDNSSVFFRPNTTVNATINSTSIYLNGVPIIDISTVTGSVVLSGNVTPANLTNNTAAWNPDPSDNSFLIRVQASSTNATILSYTVYGLSPGVNGQIYTISNISPVTINFNTEDSANETTAANRFNFPNHIALDGYMSMEIYYDGTLSRWRMVDSINIPFDHKYSLTKGVFAGGSTGSSSATSEKITYSTESRSTLSSSANTLSVARWEPAAAGNADKGFLSGGYTGAAFSLITDRVTYSTEAIAAVAGANLSQAREGPGAAGNSDKGIFAGGATAVGSATPVTTADRNTYSSETTAAVSGANLSQARALLAAVGNSDKGFFAGGFTAPATYQTTTGRTTYSTETHAAVSGANLSQGRRYVTAAGNADKGFFSGGDTPTVVATTGRTTYSTETHAAVSGANLSQARSAPAGAGNSDKGFFAGGFNPAALTTADRTTYSTETTASVAGANLGAAKGQLAAV